MLDLGLNFTYNRGRGSKEPIDVLTPRVQLVPGGQPTSLSNGLAPYSVRGLSRTNFNFSIDSYSEQLSHFDFLLFFEYRVLLRNVFKHV